jgi:hypothetical protein
MLDGRRTTTANRRLAKKRVQCLNEVLCFVSSLVLADSLELRNPLLRQAPKRCRQFLTTTGKQKPLDILQTSGYNFYWYKFILLQA